MNTRQHHFPCAISVKVVNTLNQVSNRDAAALAASVRNNTVSAKAVTAVLNFQECASVMFFNSPTHFKIFFLKDVRLKYLFSELATEMLAEQIRQ
ncbi:hypothetical protein D3C72_1526780 [compost metagenome]